MRRLSLAVAAAAVPAVLLAMGVWSALNGPAVTAVALADPGAAEAPAGADPAAAERTAAKPVEDAKPPENPFPDAAPAPGLEGGVGWLNASGPITLKDLRGKVVLLDFWTYCCINCMHVLPDLEFLEEKYGRELVVIGVHSAKFDNEKDGDAIREAILRYEIAHPVVNDAEMVLWRKFGARAWPTVVLIDPEGNYCGYVSGEGNRDLLDGAVGRLVAYHEAKGTLDRTPVRFDLERFKAEPTPLRYPGKLLVDEAGGRVFVSDSNHNRIVVAGLDGELLDVIGTGRVGRADGPYDEAEFDHPQGMALDRETLYVADTENHLIRAVDLKAKRVSTLAGTGEQARFREVGGTLKAANLSSPWDLLVRDDVLYVAMAGPHQLWTHALGSNHIGVWAGSGREDIRNGRHDEAAFAQPSGLAADDEAIYVADSEGSAIRRVPFDTKKRVTTVAGTYDLPSGRSLFEFGDKDGVGDVARLQHPLGVAFLDGVLYVADSYNHKVKAIRLGPKPEGAVTTVAGTGEAGDGLDPVAFSEPAGLAALGDELLVADTNNHRIVRLDPATGRASVFEIRGLAPPEPPASDGLASDGPEAEAVAVDRQAVRPGESVPVVVRLALPGGYKLNPLAPLAATVTLPPDAAGPSAVDPSAVGKRIKATGDGSTVTFSLPLSAGEGETGTVRISLSYGYCRDGSGGLCKIETARWDVPLTVAEGGAEAIRLTAPAAE